MAVGEEDLDGDGDEELKDGAGDEATDDAGEGCVTWGVF